MCRLQLWGLLIGAPSAHFWHAYLQKWFARKADTFDTAIQKVRLLPAAVWCAQMSYSAGWSWRLWFKRSHWSATASSLRQLQRFCTAAVTPASSVAHPTGASAGALLPESIVYLIWKSAVRQQLMLRRRQCKKPLEPLWHLVGTHFAYSHRAALSCSALHVGGVGPADIWPSLQPGLHGLHVHGGAQ